MANHTGDAIDAVLAHFADLQISDDWRFNGQTFEERVEGYVLNAIESLEDELESTEDSDELSGSDSVAPADSGDEPITDEAFLQALEAMGGQGETCSSELASILLSEHLEVSLVYNTAKMMRFVLQEDLSKWGVSFQEAFEVAKQNLAERECKVETIEQRLVTFVSRDAFDATRMLMIDRIRSFGLSRDPVAMPVTRDIVFLTGSEDGDGLRMMADLAEKSLDEERPICSIPHRLRGDTWEEWMPPTDSPVFDRFRVLRLRHWQGDYAEQRELLNRNNERTGTDVFVANFNVAKKDEKVLSYSVWTKDATTLLPEAEYVGFFSDVPLGLVPWDRVCAVVGSLMKRTDHYPARWFVDDFPTAEQFEAMGTTSLASLFGINEANGTSEVV